MDSPSPNLRKETDQRRMASSGMLRRVALVRTGVSEELRASIIRVTKIDELGTTAKKLKVFLYIFEAWAGC
jgi:hypothetical protein